MSKNKIRAYGSSVIKLDKSAWEMIDRYTRENYHERFAEVSFADGEKEEYSDFDEAFAKIVEKQDDLEKIYVYAQGKPGDFRMTLNTCTSTKGKPLEFSALYENKEAKESLHEFFYSFYSYAVKGGLAISEAIALLGFIYGLKYIILYIVNIFIENHVWARWIFLSSWVATAILFFILFNRIVIRKILYNKKALQIWTDDNFKMYEAANKKRQLYRALLVVVGVIFWIATSVIFR